MTVRGWLKTHWKASLISLAGIIITAAIAEIPTHYIDRLLDGDGGHNTVTISEPPPPRVRIDTEASLINPRGSDQGVGEYVCLVNESGDAVSLTGWKLSDSEGLVNVLSRFSLPPQGSVRVHPGGRPGMADTSHDRYGSRAASWNNSGDTITLLDAEEERVDSQHFGAKDPGEVSGSCGPPLNKNGAGSDGVTTGSIDSAGEGGGDWDCADFPTQEAAQAFFLAHGGPAQDPYGLDGSDDDGIVCESNP